MTDIQPPRRAPHPFIYLVLILPFGAVNGYLTVALAYSLSRSGMSVANVGLLIALFFIPQTWKFLWAPIVDTTLNRKSWYVIGAFLSAFGVLAMSVFAVHASDVPMLSVFVVVASLATTFLGMSVESLMAHDTPDSQKGRAAGWFQAGNLGGSGLGGGAALWLAQAVPVPWITGGALAICFILCCGALWFIAEPLHTLRKQSISGKLLDVLRDLWRVSRSRSGYLALLLVFLPICSGAATNLWSAAADDWHASAHTVELVTGAMSGIVSAIGCLIGGYVCDRYNRKSTYIVYGWLLVLCALGMIFAARTEATYIEFTMAYAFVNGLGYAGFSAVTLEAIGQGAAATKYNLFASLSNMPIAYLTALEGWAHGHWGASGFLFVDAVLGIVGIVVFTAVVALTGRVAVPMSAEVL
jgi:MFS transporter, PAT family, beta-lactamase induction signal transducer AmpG